MKQAVKSAQTKKRIASVAIKLFTQKGVEAVTVGEICKKAGIAVGTFYYYFTAKEDIYDQIISEAARSYGKSHCSYSTSEVTPGLCNSSILLLRGTQHADGYRPTHPNANGSPD